MFEKLKNFIISGNKTGLINNDVKVDTTITAKVADKMHNQLGGITNYNDNSHVQILILNNMDFTQSVNLALHEGNTNVEQVSQILDEALRNNNIEKAYIDEKLKNPEILYTVAEAQRIAYKTDEPNKRKELADLIYSKLTIEENEESNTISSAIRAMENLTNNHLKAIAFLYLFHSGYVKENVKLHNIINFYNDYISKLIDFSTEIAAGIGMTIIANGAAIVYMPSNDILSYMSEDFQNIEALDNDIKSIITKLSNTWNSLATSSVYLTPLGICLGKKYLSTIFDLMVNDCNVCSPIGKEIMFVVEE